MDVARWTQRPEIYPDRDLERLLGIVCDSRGRALRGYRLAWHREPVIEPATPARNPTTLRSQVLRAWTRQVGAGKKEKNKNKKTRRGCRLLPRSSTASSLPALATR